MDREESTGWAIVVLALLALWWLSNYGLKFLHGDTTVVQSGIVGGQQNVPTTTTYSACGG